MSSADEGAAGISASLGDEGAALQRAQDKIATMRARAGALDELPQSAVLEDVGSDTDDIQQELDETGSPPKWTRSSPRLRPRSARAHRRRPSWPGAEARALQLALGTLCRLAAENFIRPGRVAVRHPASLAARSARRDWLG
jgi:hypothetical protein